MYTININMLLIRTILKPCLVFESNECVKIDDDWLGKKKCSKNVNETKCWYMKHIYVFFLTQEQSMFSVFF